MNIWILNHYASTPDQPMTGAYYMAKALAERRCRVSMFSSSFSYYKRKEIRLGFMRLWRREDIGGVRFVWIRTTPHGAGMLLRALNMVSYFFMSIFAGLAAREKPDVIVGTCPHLPAVLAAYILSVVKRCAFAFEVRDLWPQTFIDHGMLSGRGLITGLLFRLESFLYRRAMLISTVMPGAHEYIEGKGISGSKIVWIPNGVDITQYTVPARCSRAADDAFLVMYLGGHSRYQGIDTILNAAKILQDEEVSHVRFVLVGDGSEKPALIEYAKSLDLRNLEFRGPVPRSAVASCMSEASALVFHLKRMDVIRYGISPNKLCDYMMSGKPIICAVETRNNMVRDAEAGIAIPPEDAVAMADAIRVLARMTADERAMIGQRGVDHARRYLDVRILAEKYLHEMQSVTQGG